MAKKIQVGGELESIAVGGIIADTRSIRAGVSDSDTLNIALSEIKNKIDINSNIYNVSVPPIWEGEPRKFDDVGDAVTSLVKYFNLEGYDERMMRQGVLLSFVSSRTNSSALYVYQGESFNRDQFADNRTWREIQGGRGIGVSSVNNVYPDKGNVTITGNDIKMRPDDITSLSESIGKAELTANESFTLCETLQKEKQEIIKSGTLKNAPTVTQNGYPYFCTDLQTPEGKQNGIMIYWNNDLKIWTDALGRNVMF